MSNPLKKPADEPTGMTRTGEIFQISVTARRVAAAAVLVLLAGSGAAQQQSVPNASALESEAEEVRRYAVELIIFEYVGSAADTAELFEPDLPVEPLNDGFLLDEAGPQGEVPVFGDPSTTPPSADDAVGMTPADDPPVLTDTEREQDEAFVLMPGETLELVDTYRQSGIEYADPAEYELTAAYARLDRLDAYRPLMHTRWVQPAVEQDLSTALELRRIGDPPLRLDGSVTLYASRFLHLDLDLALEEKVLLEPLPGRSADPYPGERRRGSAAGSGFAPGTTSVFYRIREDRIMRNNEVRYFDHPRFGVIAKVARIEEETPEALDSTQDLLPGVND
jgi:hypothetical protein